jgi:serine-type D-Ala-D-Ala carboxypeptidase/endopeptidase
MKSFICISIALLSLSSTAESWALIQRVLQKEALKNGLRSYVLEVYNQDHQKIYHFNSGDFSTQKPMAVASSSKWVAASLILSLVDEEKLKLDSSTKDILGWKGEKGKITLRNLLSFTSGLKNRPKCIRNTKLSLKQCVQKIENESPLIATPTKQFNYGNVHLQVAAAMAEKVTGKNWNSFYQDKMIKELEFIAPSLFYTKPKKHKGTTNPRVAGGLVISYRDYVKFLSMIYNKGVNTQGKRFLSIGMVETQEQDQFLPHTKIKNSPYSQFDKNFHYGLGLWRECNPKNCRSPIISSAGMYGFYPWLNRSKKYYAILGTEKRLRGAKSSFNVLEKIRPLIEATLPPQ